MHNSAFKLLLNPSSKLTSAAAIENISGTSVTDAGSGFSRITKTGGTNGVWDAGASSTVALSGDFLVTVKPGQTNLNFMVGVNADPAFDSNWTSVDRGVWFNGAGNLAPMSDGAIDVAVAAYTTSGFYFIRRVGSTVTLLSNTSDTLTGATLLYTFITYAATCYFDSSFEATGAFADVRVTQ